MTFLFEGILKDDKPYEVRLLKTDDIEQVLTLQEIVIQTLENKAILQPLTYNEFRYITDGNGILIGAFADQKLIAFRALLVPPVDEEGHLGLDIGIQKADLRDVIYQEISNVHPDYRGNRLQQKLAHLIMKELENQDQSFKYVCATVMPFNIPSLKDKLAQGMLIAALKEKYEGRLRYIFYKYLGDEAPQNWGQTKSLPMSDIKGQQELLQQGWRGFRMEKRDGIYWIIFGR